MIQIFTTGGTIDKVYFDRKSDYQVGRPSVVEILREANVQLEVACETLMQKDSLELTDADRALIRQRVADCLHRRVLITHGTDTMIDTALVLADIADKTVVFTGSMQPARFKYSDAEFNVGCAIVAVQLLPAGVYIAINGQVFDPRRVRKNRQLNRFEKT